MGAVAILSVGLLVGCGSGGGLKWTDDNPVWSPDGRRIAFDSDRADPKHPAKAIYVMNADGSGVRRLTPLAADAELPSWSPDGSRIAYVSNLVDASDTYTDAATINVVGVDGGRGRSVATSGWTQRPQWSPDGRWLAFQVGRSESGSLSLEIVHPSGSGFRLLASDASGFAWSPDAKHLVFSHSHYTGGSWIDIVNIESRRRVQLAQFNGDVIDAVAWAPNRSQIAVISGWITTDGSSTEKGHVYFVNTKTGAERNGGSLGVTDADGLAWLNRTSKKLVVFDNFGVYLTSTTGRQMHQVATDGCCAEPSPNGREVLTIGFGTSTDHSAVFVQTLNGGKRQLTQAR